MTIDEFVPSVIASIASGVAIIAFMEVRIEKICDRKIANAINDLRAEKISEMAKENDRLRDRNDRLYDHNEKLKEQVINSK